MGVLKVKTAPGVWTPVTQGFDPFHQQLSAVSAGGTINAGASGTVVTLTTPAIPVGRQLLVTMSVHVRQTTASAFDINMTWPAGIGIVAHQFGTGVNATGQLVTMTRVVPTTGAALTFKIDVNAWGAQAVLYGAQSNIACTVMPLATAGLPDSTPRGVVAVGTWLASPVNAPNTASVNLSQPLAFQPIIGRRYRGVIFIRATQGPSGGSQAALEIANWPGLGAIGNFIGVNAGFSSAYLHVMWLATNATPVSLIAKGTGTSAGGVNYHLDGSSSFYVEDVGA